MAYFIGIKLEPIVVNYSTVEVERIASVILNDTVNLDSDIFNTDFFTITKDSEGNIQLIDFNSRATNEILNSVNQQALEKLSTLEKGAPPFQVNSTTEVSPSRSTSDAFRSISFTDSSQCGL